MSCAMGFHISKYYHLICVYTIKSIEISPLILEYCCDILINGPPFDRLLNSGSRIIRENSVRGGKRRIDSNSKEDTQRIEGEAKTV